MYLSPIDVATVPDLHDDHDQACVHDLVHDPVRPLAHVATAATREEVVTLIQEAIAFHIEGLRQDGQPVPQPSSSVEFVDVAA